MIRLITLQNILNYIEDNLEEELSVTVLVQYSGYGRRYLQLIFKKHIGVTIWKYIKHRRITRAAYLIRLTSLPIIDIAIRLRFDSQQTFTREFKKVVGCTPLTYRNNIHWDFVSLMSSRGVEYTHPAPLDICFIDSGNVYGYKFSYEEPLPKKEFANKFRWRKINQIIKNNKTSIWLLTSFLAGEKSYESVKIVTFIGTETERLGTDICAYSEGSYAHARFEGGAEDYSRFINEIYEVTLPYYKLKRNHGVDIEIIDKCGENYIINYYMPVIIS
ncbi:TPA: helix-turn-helix domain-containing protein [Escherichia coli]|nr:helix-turn-helix domain-containing protein [Escherichia coli]HCP5797158.1 helix-turn-helix domain-containing protein [Escherichia coli]HCP5807120.1 helix-turn-helix domain-containing protein [Escherichia coli]